MNEIELEGVEVRINGWLYIYRFKNAVILHDLEALTDAQDYIGQTPDQNSSWLRNKPEYEELKEKIEKLLISKGLM